MADKAHAGAKQEGEGKNVARDLHRSKLVINW